MVSVNWRRRVQGLLAGCALGAAMMAAPGTAWGLTFTTATPEAYTSDNHVGVNNVISRADCLGDEGGITFNVTAFDGADSLEVWAVTETGIDCSDKNNNIQCVQLEDPIDLTNVMDTDTKTIELTPAAVASLVDSSGSCTSASSTAAPIYLQFITYQAGTPSTLNYDGLSVDMAGPLAPNLTNVTPLTESSLTLTVDLASTGEVGVGYYSYCFETTANSGGGGGGDATCNSSKLTAGQLPDGLSEDNDAAADFVATSVASNGHALDITYACAVAALDNVNNPSPLSNVDCGATAKVSGFDPGIPVEGCFCAAAGAQQPNSFGGHFGWLASLGLLGCLLIRRREVLR